MEILTKEQCGKILERYAGSENFNLKSYSVTPQQNQLDGLIAEQHILKIHYQIGEEENTVQFFLKILSEGNPVMFSISKSIYAFEKESFYYETFVPLLKAKGMDAQYAPKSYFSEPYVIVLEDLSLRSLKSTPKNKPLDLQHCKKCLETIAKFHAEPILYELAKSEELGKPYSLLDEFSDILEDKVFCKEENGATKFYQSSIKGLFLIIDLIPENGITKTDFKTTLQTVLDCMMISQDELMGFRSTLLHGDLWSNNFLYNYKDQEITNSVLIDFQTLKYGPPALDVLVFIMLNTRKNFREKYMDEMLTHYYNFFSNLLGRQVSEVLPQSEFRKSCKWFALPAKIHALVDRSITFMSDEDYLEAARSEESFSKYLYEDRGKYIVSGFNRNEEYKDLVIEDLEELRDMLFP